ncbi:TPA: restriction endonuclease subunit S, partial [Escherichia coli]|nr:restriction endonuclease subunit S [Escherichia coli]
MSVEKLIVDHMETWTSALQTRSTAGRGSSGKIDLYGIKKLRELILELAVRGKLVPQDPNDEPASELLKRIAAEKAELVKQGKIKKQKPLPEISEEEKPFELPQGWEWVRLGDIAEIIRGVTYGKSQSSEIKKDGMLPLLRANNIQSEILLEPIVYVDEELVSPEQYLRMGDVLIAMSSGSESLVGKAAQFFENGNYTFGAFCGVVRTYSKIVDEFIGFFLKTPLYRRQTQSSGKGIGIKNLNKSNLEMLLVAMPSKRNCAQLLEEATFLLSLCDQLEQQSLTSLDAHQQLVETLLGTLTDSQNAEELAENWVRINEHFDTLFTTEASVDALKQTILQLAVMGKLVPQDPNDEPASELLKRIAQEKAQLVKEGKIKKQKPLPPISDEEKPFELPNGWEWCRLGELIDSIDAGWSPACSSEPAAPGEWGVLKTTAVQSLEYREYENKALPKNKAPRPQLEVKAGDILITRAGPKNRVGISCLVEKTRENLMISDKIIRFHLISEDISEKYISLCLNYGFTSTYLENSKSGMAESQMNISQDILKMAPIAIPTTHEQLKITDKINEMMD